MLHLGISGHFYQVIIFCPSKFSTCTDDFLRDSVMEKVEFFFFKSKIHKFPLSMMPKMFIFCLKF